MNRNKTVFVLGAGASVPFGFPTGSLLFDNVVNGLSHPGNDLFQLLQDTGIPGDALLDFHHRLFHSGLTSVDAFLEHNPDLVDVGKRAIAAALIPYESTDTLFSGDNWYKYIFQAMLKDYDSFGQAGVSFLTYNYDRSLEHFLVTALGNTFAKPFDQCIGKVMGMHIVHLHGVLGRYPGTGESSREFVPELSAESIRTAADSIRIIHESLAGNVEFELAHALLGEAGTVCFLGFGYHPVNLKRLRVLDQVKGRPVSIFATAFGLGTSQRYDVSSYFRTVQPQSSVIVGNGAEQILEFLRNRPVFRYLERPLVREA